MSEKNLVRKKSVKQKKKMSRSDCIFHICAYIIFGLIMLICAYPFYYLLICTISNNAQVEMGKIILLPQDIHFKNYLEILRVQNLGNAAFVSIMRTVIGTATSLLVTSYLAYFFTKENMWGRKFWYRMVVITMYFSAGMIPVYLNNRMLHLTDSFWVYIIPSLISVYNMVLIKTSIEAMPAELEESALLDGAGYLKRFVSIVLPLQKPILATVALFTAVMHWNDFFTTKLYVTDTKLYTLQFLLYELLNQVTAASNQIDMAGASSMATAITPTAIRLTLTAVVTIPIVLVYPFIQKYYVKGIMIGAVKG